jgi:hypothetical protein
LLNLGLNLNLLFVDCANDYELVYYFLSSISLTLTRSSSGATGL